MSRSSRESIRDWRRGYGVVDPRNKEVISYMLWQRLLYTSAATLQLQFFTVGATGIAGNLSNPTLPNGVSFLIQAIRISFNLATTETVLAAAATGVTETAMQDAIALAYGGTALLKIGDKEYGRWPIDCLPGGCGPYGGIGVAGAGSGATTTQIGYAMNGPPDPRTVYSLGVPVVVPPQYTFMVELNWPAAITLNAGNTNIRVMLDGELMRPKQ